jgi:C-terminal processing protease CtpA/Prc
MARSSPWRTGELRYGDLIAAVDGRPVVDPQVLVQAILEAETEQRLLLQVFRADARVAVEVSVPVSRRARRIQDVRVPLLLRYEVDRDTTELGVLLGLFQWKRTPAAWRFRLFWLFRFGAGDVDELLEV